MSNKVASISQRMSLRKPQEESLVALAKICNLLPLEKGANIGACEEILKTESGFGSFEGFEHEFPSICFALATGVGKTRLMGACIAYLSLVEGIKNFLVLAPNLTIYEKLKGDFSPNSPKYVFRGISEFAITKPLLVTGENYERPHGLRTTGFGQLLDPLEPVTVNLFNISKINAESRGRSVPRIKRLSENVGQSYFEFLSELDDLVLIMDESHRYRADAGMKAINELTPILGIELTATPQIEKGARATPFRNVVYSYSLPDAMRDGFVKEPAVATRSDFDATQFDQDNLERLKLEDGVRIHESTKAELEVYAKQNGKPRVKPFMLIVAADTAHANSILTLIEGQSFFDGRYKGKAITVHSKQVGAEHDEMVGKLLEVEDPANPTEIVIHVNKLAEGWDVTNLYTIVPLRTANSRTLVEQSIGRGLRLPYGKRTGVDPVDTLTIVSHDRFEEIVKRARDADSIIRRGIVIGRDIPDDGMRSVTVRPIFLGKVGDRDLVVDGRAVLYSTPEINATDIDTSNERISLSLHEEIQEATLLAIKDFERLPSSHDLLQPSIQREIVEKVSATIGSRRQDQDEYISPLIDIHFVAMETAQYYSSYAIDIPRIIVVPDGPVSSRFKDFDLEFPTARWQPVDQEILIQSLEDDARRYLRATILTDQRNLADYIVSGLMDFNDVNYDEHADLLYKLSGQMIQYLRSYLSADDEVRNVLLYHNKQVVELIHAQMQDHYEQVSSGFEAKPAKGFTTLENCHFTIPQSEPFRDFRAPVSNPKDMRNMIFAGFRKCFYPAIKFDSDSERLLAVLFEREDAVIKWLRPPSRVFSIDFKHDQSYQPDFVAETKDGRYLFEVKRSSDMAHPDVIDKKNAAIKWCESATKATRTSWRYILVPHDVIGDSATFEGLVRRFEPKSSDQ
jgi:type III restriction enzyme